MVERRIRFGEMNTIYTDVEVGQMEIHPGDTVLQQYGRSTSVQALVRKVEVDGTLLLYDTSHFDVPVINPGARLNAVYCPH